MPPFQIIDENIGAWEKRQKDSDHVLSLAIAQPAEGRRDHLPMLQEKLP
ncbi:hypothetical protein MASR1M66_07440 [Aminivibrio sp.]